MVVLPVQNVANLLKKASVPDAVRKVKNASVKRNSEDEKMSNGKVMIVDDNKEFLEELEEILASSGYDMIAAQDPCSVMAIATKEKPQVILLDLKMPGRSGFQLAHELSRSPELQQIPIIAMTGFFKDGYKSLMDMCGIKKCLKKPFNPLDVIAEIEAALDK